MTDALEFSKMTDYDIERKLKELKVGLKIDEAKKIETILGRPPTVTEVIIWDIQGSEHCSYRSTKPYLKTLPTSAPNVILGPVEDSGVVEIARDGDDRWGLIMSHESHNHPSQIVPYEGAATGIGGNVRDVACMGGRVVGVLDSLRFGEPENNEARLIANEVVRGVAGYGNPIGVPNLGGDIRFDKNFDDNCLVNVLTVGLVKESEIIHSYVPKEAGEVGYDIVTIGKPTDNSGMGGASFASVELDEDDKEANKGAVQEPNPFLKRHLLAATYDLFKRLREMGKLDKVGFKDMGAGGNVCSTVEMVDRVGLGAEVDLEKIPVGMQNLHPSVIACSETQERFAWACHPELTDLILDHYNKKWELGSVAEGARAAVIGKVNDTDRYVLMYKGEKVCDAKATDITEGLRYNREVKEKTYNVSEPSQSEIEESLQKICHHERRRDSDLSCLEGVEWMNKFFVQLLSSENIASRRGVYNKYDKNVQGNTIIEAGEADAGVIAPLLEMEGVSPEVQKTGVAVTSDGNSQYSKISPYWQAVNAVVEAMRNVAAVGATPAAMTDCLNYNNPEKPELMWEFAEGVRGVAEACKGINLKEYPDSPTPIISGNVSLYNSVDATAMIGCSGVLRDYEKAITMQLKSAGNQLFLIGQRLDELGGSEFYNTLGFVGANVPQPDLKTARNEIFAVIDGIDQGLIKSAHDISEGGLAVALAEMTMPHSRTGGGEKGVVADLQNTGPSNLPAWKKAYSQTGGFVVEVAPEDAGTFRAVCAGQSVEPIALGKVTSESQFKLTDGDRSLINLPLSEIQEAWLNGLSAKMK